MSQFSCTIRGNTSIKPKLIFIITFIILFTSFFNFFKAAETTTNSPLSFHDLLPAAAQESKSGNKVIPIFGNPDIPINVTTGQEFMIILQSNATTGYGWRLSGILDETIIKFIRSEYRAPESRLSGAGGTEIWTFKAMARGDTTIEFEYVRPWEKDIPPVKVVRFSLRVCP